MASYGELRQSRIRSFLLHQEWFPQSFVRLDRVVSEGQRGRVALPFGVKIQIEWGNLEISVEWIDERFKWNPGEYGAVASIRVNGQDIWFPSIKEMCTSQS